MDQMQETSKTLVFLQPIEGMADTCRAPQWKDTYDMGLNTRILVICLACKGNKAFWPDCSPSNFEIPPNLNWHLDRNKEIALVSIKWSCFKIWSVFFWQVSGSRKICRSYLQCGTTPETITAVGDLSSAPWKPTWCYIVVVYSSLVVD